MDYRLEYSNRKTISLCIVNESVVVKAPFNTSKKRIENIVHSHAAWIEKHLERQKQRNEKYPPLSEEEIKILRKIAKSVLPIKTEYYAKIMGLKYGRITITGAKTRFGSCSAKGNISYSYRLMRYPEEAIDYVVVHELAHLRHLNHSSEFYKIVESVLPDYKKRAKLLKM